jgi:hypothetical protein
MIKRRRREHDKTECVHLDDARGSCCAAGDPRTVIPGAEDQADPTARPDPPQCATCPLWYGTPTTPAGVGCQCHALAAQDDRFAADYFCELHPDYPAWAVGEAARRKAAIKRGQG